MQTCEQRLGTFVLIQCWFIYIHLSQLLSPSSSSYLANSLLFTFPLPVPSPSPHPLPYPSSPSPSPPFLPHHSLAPSLPHPSFAPSSLTCCLPFFLQHPHSAPHSLTNSLPSLTHLPLPNPSPSFSRTPQNRATTLCLMATAGWKLQTSQQPTCCAT